MLFSAVWVTELMEPVHTQIRALKDTLRRCSLKAPLKSQPHSEQLVTSYREVSWRLGNGFTAFSPSPDWEAPLFLLRLGLGVGVAEAGLF